MSRAAQAVAAHVKTTRVQPREMREREMDDTNDGNGEATQARDVELEPAGDAPATEGETMATKTTKATKTPKAPKAAKPAKAAKAPKAPKAAKGAKKERAKKAQPEGEIVKFEGKDFSYLKFHFKNGIVVTARTSRTYWAALVAQLKKQLL